MILRKQAPVHAEHSSYQHSFERFIDSQPIILMLDKLSDSGRSNFHKDGAWEVCLCALILTLEPNCKIQRILESLPYDQRPMDEADFLNTMAHLGYFCRKAQSDLRGIDERLLPGVFIPAIGMPSIVISRDDEGNLLFFDPVSKMVSAVPPFFENKGNVWFFQRYDENRTSISKFMRQGSGYSWFRALLNRFSGTFAQIITAGLILNIIALCTPLFIMLVYDRVIASGAPDVLPMLALGAGIAILFEWRLRLIRSRGLSWLAGRLDNVVGNRIFSHLIGLSPDLIERASVPAQIARIKTFESVRDFFSGSVFMSLLEAPFVFIAIATIAFIAGPLVLVPLGMVLGYIGLFLFIRGKVKNVIRLAAKASSARQQFTIETFEKLESIRGYGLSNKWQEKFRHLSGREMMTHFQLGWLGTISETLAHTLTIIAAVATVGFGVHMIWAGMMTTGAMVATMILVWRILTPFYSLCTMVPRLEQLRNSIMQVNDLMEIETEAETSKGFSRLNAIKGSVSFHHVGFRYSEENDYSFSELSFEAPAGGLVVVTGNNGSGKGTLLKLIQSMESPSEGVVRIDGFDIRQLDTQHLRRQIAYVPKIPHFFDGSIIENMRYANPLAKREDVIKALETADAWQDVQAMPNQLDTLIGSYNNAALTLSLATRLSLARAYLHTGQILLIDELPNTILSGKCGHQLKSYLARAKGKRTIILCSYREDFMQLADTIVWLRGMDAPLAGDRDMMLQALGASGQRQPLENNIASFTQKQVLMQE